MGDNTQFLTDKEIDEFVSALDKDNDGCISYSEVEHGLDNAHKELVPKAKSHHLHHKDNDEERHEFLRRLMGSEKDKIPTEDFKKTVRSWEIPSLEQDKQAAKDEDDFMKNLPWGRKLRAYWEVHGPTYMFLGVVVSLQVGIGIWQCVKYATGPEYQAAFGWGVGFAKACAGSLYATMFFLVLSMSRWTATYMRRVPYITRFINWDLSQEFHIKMSIAALVLSTGHMVGHLSGTFVFGSRSGRQDAVGDLLGPDAVPMSYTDYVSTRPGWTGFTAIICFYLLALMSMPQVRKWSYEIFQLGHLLMFPMIAMLMAHGTLALLQYPVLGIVLAFPTVMVVLERVTRFLIGFQKVPASLEILDDDTVCITATIPRVRLWKYKAGQYVFLQVPEISFFQWHPFTVSECIDKDFKLHIKTDGDWTSKLRELKNLKNIGVDGPYGAPAQRFYDFDQTIIIGSGIGVTPFSGILNDLQSREDHAWTRRRDSTSSHESKEAPRPLERMPTVVGDGIEIDLNLYRRVDFHWIIRDRAYIEWFSTLLNKVSTGEHNPNLDIHLHNHVTKKRKDVPTHVYRWLLEKHRTPEQPYSPLTGLIAPTHFGRPDFPRIFNEHYDEMMKLFSKDKQRKRRVGVFFCGAPIIGRCLDTSACSLFPRGSLAPNHPRAVFANIHLLAGHQLADLCHEMTLRGRHDGSEIEYFFQLEVFG